MAYDIYLGSFDKRVNSTKVPDYSQWAHYDNIFLKTPTDYDSPVLTLNVEFASFAPLNYNYAVMFGRYYWVTGLTAVRTGVTQIALSLDIFASRRNAIMDTKAFIEYGMNTFDAGDAATRIADARRAVNKNPSITSASASLTGGDLSTYGSYILQTVGAQSGVTCYAVTYTQLQAILLQVRSDVTADVSQATSTLDPTDPDTANYSIAKLLELNLTNSLVAESAMSAIKAIHWLPISWSSISGSSEPIYLGNYATAQNGKRLDTNATWTHSGSVNIPWSASDWQRANSQVQIYLPFFGTVPLPVDQCINQSSISFTVAVDLLGGDMTIRVTSGTQTVYTGSTNVAAPFAVGFSAVSASAKAGGVIQAATGSLQMAGGVVDAGASIAGAFLGMGTRIADALTNVGNGAQNIINGYAQTVQPLITSAGSMGGIAALGQDQNVIVTVIHYAAIPDSDFEALYGHPVFKVDKPALGFCKTRGFSIELGNEPQYISIINAAMDGGMFIE